MKQEGYEDFISYQDDDGTVKEAWVKILRADNMVEFELPGGVLILLPYQRVLKIKRRLKNVDKTNV